MTHIDGTAMTDLPEQSETTSTLMGGGSRRQIAWSAMVATFAITAGVALGLTGHTAAAVAVSGVAAAGGVTVNVNVRQR
ncbi:hypothetical protein [Streptantibioticus silvisoli]|uniref:Uncharacterized protein n=1 Tax=Streptantibioticus silvisoli TaxID=2705255 RepID=A0ABT6W281_9ACTN|nr:hypothetical protein [Streptantibioticus silvisoli]MDI5964853.1 hypothetical protein [Streptantibioticus silvisoli]